MKSFNFPHWRILDITYFTLAILLVVGCGKGSFSIESGGQPSDVISLSIQNSSVNWNGSKLIGNIDLKSQNSKGVPVSNYVPEVSVVSTNSLSEGFFAKVRSAFYSVLSLKNDVTTLSAINYTLVPCTASDSKGLSSCAVEVLSGTGEIRLQISGANSSSPLEISLVISPHPQLTSVVPTSISSGNIKSILTINGSNFRSPMQITIGDISCTNVQVVSSTQVTCEITTDTSIGLKDILIKNPDLQLSLLPAAIQFTDDSGPTLSITQKPAALTNSSTAQVILSAQDNITSSSNLTWQCLLDGSPYACSTSPLNLSSLSEGPHDLLIQVSDASGNATSENISWVVDTTAPTLTINNAAIGSSPSASTASRSVALSGPDVVKYKAAVSRSGNCSGVVFTSVAEVDIGTPFSLNITTDGSYRICAIGRDPAGNWQSTATISSELMIDTSIPYIVGISGDLTSPSNSTTARSLTLSGSSTQAYKAATLKNSADCGSVDFGAIAESSMSTPYSLSFSGDGSYIVCAIGRNSANVWQTSPTASTPLVIDTAPGTLAAFSLGSTPSSSKITRSIYLSGTDIVQWKASTYTTSGSCDTTALNASTASSTSTPYSLVTATDDTYYVCALGMDSAGNWQTSPTTAGPLVIDSVAPTLTKTSPASGSSFQGAITVNGTCENGQTVTLNASTPSDLSGPASAACSGGAFSINATLTGSDGSKSLVLTSSDAALNTSTVAFALMKDTTAPNLSYTAPAALTVAKEGLRIEGTCEVGLAINLGGTGLSAPSTASCVNGVFSQDVAFSATDGNKIIQVSQTDAAGNNTAITRTFVKDSTPPSLAFTSPDANTPAKSGLTLTGTCEEGLTISLAGSGLASPSSTTCNSGGVFSVAILFTSTDGSKVISATQTDAVGNSSTLSRTFVRDNIAPVLTFTSAAVQNQSNNLNFANFSGSCEDGSTISVSFNSATEGTTDCIGGAWAYRVASQLTDAVRSYNFSATDTATNQTLITGTWTRDATAPNLTLTSAPAAGATLAGGSAITIGWSGSDPHINNITDFPIQLKYSANGGANWSALAGPLMNSGSYGWTLPSLNTSNFKIQVSMTDSFGNVATAESAAFTVDSSAPIVTLTSLTGGQLLKGGVAQAVSWSVLDSNIATDAVSISYSLGGGAWQSIVANIANSGLSSTGSYNWTPSVDGSYIIRVQATDKGGLTGQVTSTSAVIVDATAPALTNLKLNGATSGLIVSANSTVTIAWSASDNNFGSYPITLFYSVDNGSSWTSVGAAVAATPSSYSWNISSLAFADGDNYKVKVVATDKVGNFTELSSSAFSVRSSAPILTFDTSVNTNFFSNTNSVTYSGTCTNGTAITVSGPNASNPAPTCSGGTWSWSTDVVSTDAVRTYTFTQNNGLSTSITATWTRDTVNPGISGFTINGGDSSTSNPNLSLQFSATDLNATAGLRYQLVMASIVTQACPSVGTSWTALPESGSLSRSWTITAPNGQKTFCLWIADAAGNISSSSRAINFNAGTIPTISSFSVTNGILGDNYGTTNYAAGDTVKISWTVTDTEGLASNPVYLDITTDGTNWTALENGFGNLANGTTNHSYNYTGYSAPSGFFRVRIRVQDASSNWSYAQLSTPQNVGNWSIIAGTTERGIGGGPLSANLASNNYGGSMAAINPQNLDIYASDSGYGIVKISGTTNLVSPYIKHDATATFFASNSGVIDSTTKVNVTNTSLVFDGGYLYLMIGGGLTASAKIYRINPADDTYTLYYGGGTNAAAGATKTAAFVMFDAFRFDENHNLYYFSSCASPTSSYNSSTTTVKLMRVGQDESGNAKTAEFVAGQCTTPATPTSGALVDATPLGLGTSIGMSDLAVWNNGDMIYYRLGNQDRAYKIVTISSSEKRIYNTNLTNPTITSGGLAYSKLTGHIYFATGKVEAWNPTTSASSETSAGILAASAGTGVNCYKDGVTATTDSCISSVKLLSSEGQIIIPDGASAHGRSYRLRFVDGNQNIYTLAGSLGFIGDGSSAVLSRGQFRGLFYRNLSLNTSVFPNGLYLSDPISDALVYIDNSNIIHSVWGNQTSTCKTSYGSETMSTGISMGCGFALPNVSSQNINFDSSGLLWTRNSWSRMSQVQTNKTITQKTTSTSTAQSTNMAYVDTASLPSAINYYHAFSSNMTMKDTLTTQADPTARQGFFSLGGFYNGTTWTNTGATLRYVDFKKSQIIHIMGTPAAPGTTADATNTNLGSSPLSSSCVLASDNSKTPCFTRFAENDPSIDTDDELYFAEGNLLRVITNPLNPGSQTLKTLLTESATISNFILYPNFADNLNNRRIYYVMGGLLYCFALDKKSENADCKFRASQASTMETSTEQKHSPLGPPTGMLSLTSKTVHMADSMAWKDRTTLFLANGSGEIYQYKVPQPTAITQNLTYGVNIHGSVAYGGFDTTRINQNMYDAAAGGAKMIRYTIGLDSSTSTWITAISRAQSFIAAAKAQGMERISIVLAYDWVITESDKKTFKTTFNEDSEESALYTAVYNAVYYVVSGLKNENGIIIDYELANEINLRGTLGWNQGWTAANWQNTTLYGSTRYWEKWMMGMKGASDAIAQVNQQNGTAFRRGLGIVGTHLGFLDLADLMGVNYDFISYHAYNVRASSAYSQAGAIPGSGVSTWNLFPSLAKFQKPVSLNEINCGEVYDTDPSGDGFIFDNSDTQSKLYIDCMHALKNHLNYWRHASQLDVESIVLYELRDQPQNHEPENRFGMFWTSPDYSTYSPKPQYYLMKAIMGVPLNSTEESVLGAYPGLLPIRVDP